MIDFDACKTTRHVYEDPAGSRRSDQLRPSFFHTGVTNCHSSGPTRRDKVFRSMPSASAAGVLLPPRSRRTRSAFRRFSSAGVGGSASSGAGGGGGGSTVPWGGGGTWSGSPLALRH